MKIDRFEYRVVINHAKSLQYTFEHTPKGSLTKQQIEEICYLIEHEIHRKIAKNARRSLVKETVSLNDSDFFDFLLLKKYVDLLHMATPHN